MKSHILDMCLHLVGVAKSTSRLLVGFVMSNTNKSSRSKFVRVNAYMLHHYEEFEFELNMYRSI